LSAKHLKKVEETENPVRKIRRYKRFYHRDSIRQWRQSERKWVAMTDSLALAAHQRREAIESRRNQAEDDIHSKVYTTVYRPWARREAHIQLRWLEGGGFTVSGNFRIFILNYYTEYFLTASQDDKALAQLKRDMPNIAFPKELYLKLRTFRLTDTEKYNQIMAGRKADVLPNSHLRNAMEEKSNVMDQFGEVKKYAGYGKTISNTDSLGGFVKTEAERLATEFASGHIEGFSQVNEGMKQGTGMVSEYQSQVKQLGDSAYLKAQAKKKAEEMAMNYFSENPGIMLPVQQKMNLLMKKYSVVPNSTDLSTAIKRNSLQGRTFKERLVLGGNFQIITLKPFTIDASPLIGYRFNRNFNAGIGGNYRQTFGDTIQAISPSVLGYKAFTSYDLLKDFFAYAEFARNSAGIHAGETFSARSWKNAAFLGVGRKFRLHQKLEMTTSFLYNFLYDHNDPIYPKRWNFRIGFQSSELAFLKRGK
jgi:hypothetical protein